MREQHIIRLMHRANLIHNHAIDGNWMGVEDYLQGMGVPVKNQGRPFWVMVLDRTHMSKDVTLGTLTTPVWHENGISHDLQHQLFECFTLENPAHERKVMGDTRIPEGLYPLVLRNEGGKNKRYRERFGLEHHGMLWIQDIPNFEWVYLHIGNTKKDTDGCILPGTTISPKNQFVGQSTQAYSRMYKTAADIIRSNFNAFIWIRNPGPLF